MGVFQRTLVAALNSTGIFWPSALPVPLGPRKRDHVCALVDGKCANRARAHRLRRTECMIEESSKAGKGRGGRHADYRKARDSVKRIECVNEALSLCEKPSRDATEILSFQQAPLDDLARLGELRLPRDLRPA